MTLAVDADRSRWLYVPVEFPLGRFADEPAWRDAVVGASGFEDERATWLADYLTGLRANNTGGAHRYAWIGDGFATLVSLDARSWPHDAGLTLHEISGSDGVDTDARPALVTEITVPGLGTGDRVERAMRVPVTAAESIGPGTPETEIVFLVLWVFRGSEDVVFSMSSADPTVIARALPDAEALMATASVVLSP